MYVDLKVSMRGQKELMKFLSPQRQKAMMRRIRRNVSKELAEQYVDTLAQAMYAGEAEGPALAESTTRRKGHSTPWIDTTGLVESLTIWRLGDKWFGGIPPGTTHPKKADVDLSLLAQYLEGGGPQLTLSGAGRIQPRPIFLPTFRKLQARGDYPEKIVQEHTARELEKEARGMQRVR